jgi:FkbM family methyltransferase
VRRWPDDAPERKAFQVFVGRQTSLLIDIGANRGQFGKLARAHGYAGPINSFEPLDKPYQVLEAVSAKDKNWKVFNYGFGNCDGEFEMQVAGNQEASSSILIMKQSHVDAAPGSRSDIKSRTVAQVSSCAGHPGVGPSTAM